MFNTVGESHSASYLLKLSNEYIDACEADWKVKIGSLVTDNAANMALMRKELKKTRKSVHVYGCNAHIANLPAKDILSATEEISV